MWQYNIIRRSGSRAAAASKMECFLIIVNGWKPLTIITKHPILDAAAAVDPPLIRELFLEMVATLNLIKADHRIMFHVSHAVKVDKFYKVAIASSNTFDFVCALYYLTH